MVSTQSPDAKIIKEGQVVIRARNLRAAAGFIPLKKDKNNVNGFITLTDLGFDAARGDPLGCCDVSLIFLFL
ncbi:hypothetical protein HanXRQr2_Chr08g0338161 [Helianthus annuus]|uniref:Uncharacterized protein n=1 Tax=Helianthus annuus TaxID=4232 RepID=A0A9K3IFK3_HELAN|nr:hypothetical protein HanXRQr2_Chr08g0338161 [Helianthus annuus]